MKRACKGTNRRGKPCGVAPTKGTDWCRAHDPNVPEADRFGSPEQSAKAGGSPKPHVPKVIEALAAKVEERAEDIIQAYIDGLAAQRAVVVGNGPSATLELVPDDTTRMSAADRMLDRVVGKPRQSTEITGAQGGPVRLEGEVDLSRLAPEQLRQLRELLAAAGDAPEPG